MAHDPGVGLVRGLEGGTAVSDEGCEMCGFLPGLRYGDTRDLDYAGVTARLVRYRSLCDLPAVMEVHFGSDAVEVGASVPIAYCPWYGSRLEERDGLGEGR